MKLIDIGICVDNIDPKGVGRIRLNRYSSLKGAVDGSIKFKEWDDKDPFIALPFLPTNINFIPEIGQTVKVLNYNSEKETVNMEYIAGPFTTMHDFNSQTHSKQIENTTYGNAVKHTKEVINKLGNFINPESKNSHANYTDYAVYGKYGSDVLFTRDGLVLRGGKFKSKTNSTASEKTELLNQPIMSDKLSTLYLKKFGSYQEWVNEPVTRTVLPTGDLKFLVEYSLDNFTGSTFNLSFYIYALKKDANNVYTIVNDKLSTAPYIAGYYDLVKNVSTASNTITYTYSNVSSITEASIIVRDFVKRVHSTGFNNDLFPTKYTYTYEGDLHPFFFRPTLECKNRSLDATGITNRETFFSKVKPFDTENSEYGLIYSKTQISAKPKDITTNELKLKIQQGKGEQTFAALKSDKMYFISTSETVKSSKKIDFSVLNGYELTQENYLNDIEPNTYSTVRGENLVKLLKKMCDLLESHVHGWYTPLIQTDPNYIDLKSLLQSIENDILNDSIRIN
jgi:hypothetical protein